MREKDGKGKRGQLMFGPSTRRSGNTDHEQYRGGVLAGVSTLVHSVLAVQRVLLL